MPRIPNPLPPSCWDKTKISWLFCPLNRLRYDFLLTKTCSQSMLESLNLKFPFAIKIIITVITVKCYLSDWDLSCYLVVRKTLINFVDFVSFELKIEMLVTFMTFWFPKVPHWKHLCAIGISSVFHTPSTQHFSFFIILLD